MKKSNGTTGTLYWTGTGSEPISESNLAGTDQEEYIFFGPRVARRDVATNAVHYYFSDHLGSASIVTNASGAIEDESDYYPYGGEMVITNTVPQNYKFTGKERDAESGLDDFGARYHASALGRFMTPDWDAKPVAVPYAKFGDPQTLNLYSYVENAPVNRVDADGHTDKGTTAAQNTVPCGPGGSSQGECAPNVSGTTAQNKPTIQFASNEQERQLTVVVFNETGGLTASAKSGDGSAENLHDARVAVAEVSERVIQSGHPDRVASDNGNYSIQTGLWQGLHDKNANAINAWNDSLSAARTALGGSNTTNGATNFRLDAKSGRIPKFAKGRDPSQTFGPFRNAGGGDAARRPRIYVYE